MKAAHKVGIFSAEARLDGFRVHDEILVMYEMKPSLSAE